MDSAEAKKVLVLALVDPSGNPRPKRAIALLQHLGYEVHVASFDFKSELPVYAHYRIPLPSKRLCKRLLQKIISILTSIVPLPCFIRWHQDTRWGLSKIEREIHLKIFDIILVEDLDLLPMAVRIKKNAKIIFDAREFYPRQYEHNFLWSMTERFQRIRMCRDNFPSCDGFITVSEGLAREYKKEFSVNPTVIRSVPFYHDISIKPTDGKKIRVVHHGVANSNRRIENMIDVAHHLDDRFLTDFYLVGNPSYVSQLKKRAGQNPRIRFCAPVPFENIIPMLNEYDIGLSFLEPTTFNLKHCLPNKLFEFIQARLMVATGPSPDMSEIVSDYNIGIVTERFCPQLMASKMNALTAADIDNFKYNSAVAAKALSFEEEGKKFVELISGLV